MSLVLKSPQPRWSLNLRSRSRSRSGRGREKAGLFAREGATMLCCDINPDTSGQTARLVQPDGLAVEAVAPVDLGDQDAVVRWISDAIA